MNEINFVYKKFHNKTLDKLKDKPTKSLLIKASPWIAGAGIAVGHIMTSSNCTLPQQGKCSTCGSCIIAIGSLITWALAKKNNSDNFYIEKSN